MSGSSDAAGAIGLASGIGSRFVVVEGCEDATIGGAKPANGSAPAGTGVDVAAKAASS